MFNNEKTLRFAPETLKALYSSAARKTSSPSGIIGISLPNSVELKVTECEPSVKGNTATGATKNATVETGYVVRVPLFVNEGDVLRIDTRTGNYIERA